MTQEISIMNLNKSLNNFIKDDEMRVLVLKGEWGVGKTYQWNKFINSKIKTNEEFNEPDDELNEVDKLGGKFVAYSYVSLFGKKSISDIKQSIFNDAVSLIDTEGLKKAYKNQTKGAFLKESFKSISEQFNSSEKKLPFIQRQIAKVITSDGGLYYYLKKIFPKFNDVLSDVENILTHGFLVCIDDMERKSSKLTVVEVMGMIDEMVNKKECKVVLLFNKENLKHSIDEKNDSYSVYREKLVDLEILHNPTFKYNFDLIFKNSDELIQNVVFDMVVRLEIKNIRVLKKINWLINQFWHRIEETRDEVKTEFLNHATFLAWAYYTQKEEGEFESYCELLKQNNAAYIKRMIDEAVDTEPNRYEKIIQLANIGISVFNSPIIDCLNSGYLIYSQNLSLAIDKRNQDYQRDEVNKNLSEIWNLYSDTFDDNLNEFQNQLKEFFEENMQYVYIQDLDSMLDFIDAEDHEYFIRKFLDLHKIEDDVDEYTPFVMRLKNHLLRNEILQKVMNSDKMTIDDALSGYKKGSWDKNQIDYLQTLNVENLMNWMKSNPVDLVAKIRRGLLTFNDNDQEFGGIKRNTVTALQKIAAENSYNAKRIKNLYNINPE